MADGHCLRRLGADHQRRVAIDNPGLIGADSFSCRGAVMVEDPHQTIDTDTAKGMFLAGRSA